MKKILLSIFSLLMFTGIFAQGWNYVSSTGTTFILFGMSFPPGQSSIGYACGMQYTYDADGVIVKTTDGGNNWTQIWPVSGTIDGLQGIWFINDNVGFAGGWNNYFIKTVDGGTSWTPVSCGTNVWYYNDVVFWDANNGVACASMNSTSDQSVFITSDGGSTWTPATSGSNVSLSAVAYADQNTLFGVNNSGTVYKSVDGGHNWTANNTLSALLFGVGFANANFGVIGGEEKIFATNDGGNTWTTYTTGYENFTATEIFSDGTAYVGGSDENIYVTTDYGNTWAMEHNGTGFSHLYRIRYTPDGKLTACGSQGTIIQRAPVLTAAFGASSTEICEGDIVSFTDQSVGNIVSWSWTFEGGTPPASVAQNPSVTYNTSGTYDVTLEVSDGNATHSITQTDYITVSAVPSQASAPVGPDEVCGGETVDYTTNTVTGASNYLWMIEPSDAGTISGTGTTGTFTASTTWTGAFTVKVRAENDCGDGAFSPTLSATLYHSPVAYFLVGGGSYCDGAGGLEITLEGSESGIDYELFHNSLATGIIVAGTGSPISFGNQTEAGLYTAVGYATNCTANMYGQPYITIINVPGQAGVPDGPDMVCNNMVSDYTTSGSYGADTLYWVLTPVEAGILMPGPDMISIVWHGAFEGIATLSLYGSNECGDGSMSPELEIYVSASPQPEISGLSLVCENDLADYSTAENPGSTYLWSVEGGDIIAGAGTSQVTVQWGSYGLGYLGVIEDNGTCADTTDNFEVQIDECTAIDELQISRMKVYPNPANNTLHIECLNNETGGYTINVWNIHGKLLEKEHVNEGTNHSVISVIDYPAGLYFVEIVTQANKYARERFIVSH